MAAILAMWKQEDDLTAFWHWLTWRAHPSCVLNLKADKDAIAGVLRGQRGDWLVVKQPRVLAANGSEAPADGEILVHRTEVLFVQVLPVACLPDLASP